MADQIISVAAGNLSGQCFKTLNDFYQAFLEQTTWFIPGGLVGVVTDPTTPSADDRGKLWVKTDAGGCPIGIYYWCPTVNTWVWPVDRAGVVDTFKRRIWMGDPVVDLDTYDGGSAGPVTDATGPTWEVDTLFDDAFPLGVVAVIAAAGTLLDVFDDAVPGPPQAIGVYFLKRTSRKYYVG